MAESTIKRPTFRPDEPWGEDSQFYVVEGHVDKALAFALLNKAAASLCSETLTDAGWEPDDLIHGWATPDPYPRHGYDADEWVHFHRTRHDDTSVAITFIDVQDGAALIKDLPDLGPPPPIPAPEVLPAPDPTFGGRLIRKNVHRPGG